MVFEIPDWKGAMISVARSRAAGTIAVCDIDDNLIPGPVKPWPSAELLQKLYAADRSDSFETGDYSALARRLGFYCDLQSINSEDAMTWSYFDLLVHANAEVRAQFMEWLLSRIGVAESTDGCSIWLWRRIVHPDKPISPGGPEIDFGLHSSNCYPRGGKVAIEGRKGTRRQSR